VDGMSRSLRFCMMTTFYPPHNFGGDGIMVQRLARALVEKGHRVDVIHCLDAYRCLAGKQSNTTSEADPTITVFPLKSPYGILSPLATHQIGMPLFKSARIRQILARGYDVIHFHNITLIGGPGILPYGNAIKLYTIHDYWLLCPNHVMFRFNREVCTRRHCFFCSLVYKRPYPWWRLSSLMKKTVRHVDSFIAPSRFCRDMHHDRGLAIPIEHIPNFVPAGESVPFSSQRGSDDRESSEPYFLYAGRLEKLKGLQTIIPLFRKYGKARLIVAGTGSYASTLRKLAQGDDKIRFVGFQSQEHLSRLYRGAVALIVPSLCDEIFSNVVIESFRQGTPVLCRNSGGMPELIEASGAGFVYDTNEELMAAMERLRTEGTYRDALGRCGFRAYQREWTADAYLQRYFGLIARIAERKQFSTASLTEVNG
jgi:glycosyltransferase involved in cell wall biosynthesis